MKTHQRLDYQSLISHTSTQLKSKFQPEIGPIKQRIESLIERGYMERDENDKRIFKYIA